MSTSSTVVEETHELEPHILAGRARAAVILFIISDVMSVMAILAAGGYLSALNVLNQYRVPGDHPPSFVLGLIVAIAIILSAVSYYVWGQGALSDERGVGQSGLLIAAFVLMLAATVIQIIMGLTLGYAGNPYHAYESVMILITWYSAIHFLLSAIIGLLLIGRIMRGRMAGRGFLVEASGYWWYYTVIAGLLMWVFTLVLH
jgi:hypothetical protein